MTDQNEYRKVPWLANNSGSYLVPTEMANAILQLAQDDDGVEYPDPPPIAVEVLDTVTGERKWSDVYFNETWWTEGNGACDCNRELVFDREKGEETYFCSGANRYLVVATTGIQPLADYNADYPKELRYKHGLT